MKKYTIEQIGFASYMKIISLSGCSLGLLFGCFGLLGGLIGADVQVTFGETVLTGLPAGLMSIIIAPIICTIIFGMFALFAYIPFKIIMKIKGKIDLMLHIRGE